MSEMCKWNPRGAACNERIAAAQRCTELASDLATAQRELVEAQGKAERAETLRREVAEYLLDVETERDEAIKQRDAAKQVIACMKGLDRAHREAIQQAESEHNALAVQVGEMRVVLTSLLQDVTSSIQNITNRANGGQFVDGERFTLGAARHVKRYLEPLLALTSTQAEQRYAAAVEVVEIAPKMLDICYTSDEHCALCKQAYQQCDEWRMRQALDRYAALKVGDAK